MRSVLVCLGLSAAVAFGQASSLTITTANPLFAGTVGTSFQATGGSGSYTWTITAGSASQLTSSRISHGILGFFAVFLVASCPWRR